MVGIAHTEYIPENMQKAVDSDTLCTKSSELQKSVLLPIKPIMMMTAAIYYNSEDGTTSTYP